MPIKLAGPISVSGNVATVTIEGDKISEVNSTEAKALATQAGIGYLNRPGVSSQSGPYPVDPDTNMPYANPMEGLKAGTKYRQDFNLQGGL